MFSKSKRLFLILVAGFLFSTEMIHAKEAIATINDDNSTIIVKKTTATASCGYDKGAVIHASLNGHILTVVFSENLGEVAVDVLTASGSPVQGLSVLTPNGLQVYIPLTGDYIVNFTLPDGDEYYGEFTVTD